MKAIVIGKTQQIYQMPDEYYTDVIELDDANLINKEDLQDAFLIIDYNKLHTFIEHMEIFDMLPSDRIAVLVWGDIYRLSDEQDVIKKLKLMKEKGDWSAAKKMNQALICFDFMMRRVAMNGRPNYMQIETSSFCNARCIMCIHYYDGNTYAKNIDKHFLERLAEDLGVCYMVALNGMGEPFVHPDIEHIIEGYAEKNIFLFSNTNLSILTPKLLKLINDNFFCLEISCDGATKETFEAIRKNLSFETFKQNLMLLKEHCPKTQKRINMVIMRQNAHEMCKMIELAVSADVSFVSFSNLQPNPVIGDEEESLLNYPHVLDYYCQQAYEFARKMNIKISCPVPEKVNKNIDPCFDEERDIMVTAFSNRKIKSISQMKIDAKAIEEEAFAQELVATNVPCVGICEWALDRTYIDLLGDVSVCCCRRIFRMGKIDEEHSLESVWNGEQYQRLRTIFHSGWLPNCCVNCGLLDTQRIKFLKILDRDKLRSEVEFKKKFKHKLDMAGNK